MKAAKLLMSAAASAVLAGSADAQFLRGGAPAAGGLPTLSGASPVLNGVVPPAPLGLGVGPGAQTPGGLNTIWARLGIAQEQREFCRRKICRTPAGQLIGRLMAPVSAFSGGVIPPFCPTVPSIAELLDPGPVGAASKAKLDRAGAEERMKAVKYLGTLDCHYWPEAEEALIGALRADRNECVRYEAAVALSKGCCCTCKVIVALSHVVSCSDADGHPYEKSARVRAVAAHALDRCMANCNCATPGLPSLPVMENAQEKPKDSAPPAKEKGKEKGKEEEKKDEKKLTKLGDPEYPKEYYAAVAKLPREQVGAFGRKALEIGANIGYTVVGEINARDYAAAGLTASNEGQSSGAKPKTIMELLTWKDSGASISKPLVGPPPAYAGATATVATTVAQPVEKLVPVPTATTATNALPPAFLASQSKSGSSAAPVVTMPSSGTAATRIAPQPLKVPVVNSTPANPIATTKTPVPAAPRPVAPAATPKSTPAPAPIAIPMAPALTIPPAPAALPTPRLPDAKLPAAKATDLPPVEKIAPTVVIPIVDGLPPVEKVK
jgi:hypothetical protein